MVLPVFRNADPRPNQHSLSPGLLRDAPDGLPAAPYDGANHVRLHEDPQREVDLSARRVSHRAGQTAAASATDPEPLKMNEDR